MGYDNIVSTYKIVKAAKGEMWMFGYLLPYKPELKMREFECYRAVYCGLCKQLAKDYGFSSRMLLNYDMVLLSLMADGLANQPGSATLQRCMVNPKRRPMLNQTSGLQLAADCTVLASWYKVLDDRQDEPVLQGVAAGGLGILLKRAFHKAAARRPEVNAVLADATRQQSSLEKERTTSYDKAAHPTACMTGAMFAECSTQIQQRQLLYRMGLFLGKIIYYLDAAEDYTKDKEKGRYNVFLENGLSLSQTVETAKIQCSMAAAGAAECYTQLSLQLNKPLWDNILYLGIPQAIANAGMPRRKLQKHPG